MPPPLAVPDCVFAQANPLTNLDRSLVQAEDIALLRAFPPRTLPQLAAQRDVLKRYAAAAPCSVLAGYCAAYVLMQTFAVPGTIMLSLLAGGLYGTWRGAALVAVVSTAGSCSCYCLSWVVGQPLARAAWAERVDKFAAEVGRRRHQLFNYIIFLRVTPMPNTFINVASPIVGVPLAPFALGKPSRGSRGLAAGPPGMALTRRRPCGGRRCRHVCRAALGCSLMHPYHCRPCRPCRHAAGLPAQQFCGRQRGQPSGGPHLPQRPLQRPPAGAGCRHGRGGARAHAAAVAPCGAGGCRSRGRQAGVRALSWLASAAQTACGAATDPAALWAAPLFCTYAAAPSPSPFELYSFSVCSWA